MDIALLRKAVAKNLSAWRRADTALKELAALPDELRPVAFRAAELADELAAAARDLEPGPARAELERAHAAFAERVQAVSTDAAAKLAAAIASDLGKDAPVTGQLPDLKWGLLRLEFKLAGPKRELVLWYGPKIAKLASAPLEPAEAAKVAREARAALDVPALDEAAFVAEVTRAYESARRRLDVAAGGAVPILQALRELVFARQDASFTADPVASNFASAYGRVRFSYDLYRAGPRGGLALGVAAHAQTRRPEDHLWVPTSPSGDGTHFATLAVRAPKA